jgi:hypothetical protein
MEDQRLQQLSPRAVQSCPHPSARAQGASQQAPQPARPRTLKVSGHETACDPHHRSCSHSIGLTGPTATWRGRSSLTRRSGSASASDCPTRQELLACAPGYPCALYASGLTARRPSCSIWVRITGPETVQRIWDSSGFYARISSPSPSAESALDGSHWRELYRAALLELDLDKLAERVEAAEEAIRARASLNGDIASDERIAIQDAMPALNVLKASVKRYNPPSEDSGL